jgi:ribosomal protein L37AE/L43A
MTVERFRGKVIFSCNECGDQFETEETDWNTALAVFQNDPVGEQWETINDNGTWEHYCKDCKEQI